MVIDSHVLLWFLNRDSQLSEKAQRFLKDVIEGKKSAVVTGATLWELRVKERRNRLVSDPPVSSWAGLIAKEFPDIQLVDTTPDVWLRTADLDWTHRDPADRMIAATALEHGLPVLTKDRKFHAPDSPVKAVW